MTALTAPKTGPAPARVDRRPSRILRHCPRCWRKTVHQRHVSNGLELLTCDRCGHLQTYRLDLPPESD